MLYDFFFIKTRIGKAPNSNHQSVIEISNTSNNIPNPHFSKNNRRLYHLKQYYKIYLLNLFF